MSEILSVRDADVTFLRGEIHRLEMLVEGLAEAAEEITRERDELRAYVAARTRLEMGTADYTLEDFWKATELPEVKAVIAATLKEGLPA